MIQSARFWPDEQTIQVVFENGLIIAVPDDMANPYRVELEEWSMVKGNIIEPYTPPAEPKKRK